jgi:hypothetical protein
MVTGAVRVVRHAAERGWLCANHDRHSAIRSYVGPVISSAGFRPFFLGASIWAAAAIPLWLRAYAEGLTLPTKLAPLMPPGSRRLQSANEASHELLGD